MRAARSERARFLRASAIGAVLAALPFTWLLAAGRAELAPPGALTGFYDAQAHSFLDLRWDVPAEVLSVEAFTVDGRSYMYFGPTPALLRLPVAAVTDRFDGRLTQVSMLLAYGVALASAARLSWRVRTLLGPAPLRRIDLVAAGCLTSLLGAGSALLYLAGGPIVYHEAIIWGVALSLAAYDALLAYLDEGTGRRLAWATALACLAVLARASVGMGPVIAIGLVLADRVVRSLWSRRRGRGHRPHHLRAHHLLALGAAAALPVVLQVGQNLAKFGTLFSIPFEAQLVTRMQPGRTELLRETGGTLFGLEYIPTTALHYLRPDGIALDRRLPWIGFPEAATVIGDVPFDVIDRSSSLPATMPWLVVLAVAGAVVLARRRTWTSAASRTLWPAVVGAAAAPVVTLAIAYVANRYLADFLPLLVLTGAVGLHALLRLERRRRAAAGTAVLLLGVVACLVNLAHGLLLQRSFGPPQTPENRAELVAWQRDADDLLPGDQGPEVTTVTGRRLPERAPESQLAVVGACDALYQFDGAEWRVLERTSAGGRHLFQADLADVVGAGTSEPLLVGDGDEVLVLAAERDRTGAVTFSLTAGAAVTVGEPVPLEPGPRLLELVLDPRLRVADLRLDGEVVLSAFPHGAEVESVEPDPGVAGALRRLPTDAPLCRSLVDR